MTAPTILVVEDNPTSRKLFRVSLELEGFAVVEAEDGRTAIAQVERSAPDLVIHDLCLPDIAGIDLARQMRALPRGWEFPIVVLSGFLERIQQARSADVGLAGFLVKPIEPSRLVEAVRRHLPDHRGGEPAPQIGGARRVLVVDDEPIQRRLLQVHLVGRGFQVVTAADGRAAIELARADVPDAIVSDVLMPGMDGFELCLQVRRDPRLARVPVVLVSSHYVESEDQAFARKVGANALVRRTPSAHGVIDQLSAALAAGGPAALDSVQALHDEHTQRLIGQLERQLRMNAELVQTSALQAAQLKFFQGMATGGQGAQTTMRDALVACLDGAGLSLAAIYLVEPGGLPVLQHAVGFEASTEQVAALFGHAALIEGVVATRVTLAIPSSAVSDDVSAHLLRAADASTALVVPLVSDERCVGALLLGSHGADVTSPEAMRFAEGLAGRIGQTLDLVGAHVQAAAAQQRYALLMEHANDMVSVLRPDGVILEVNRRCEELMQLPRERILGRHVREFAAPGRAGENARSYDETVAAGGGRAPPIQLVRADGSVLSIEFSNTPIEVQGERLVLAIGRDVTEQLRTQAQLMLSDRMASVGMLSAGLAHEINNPLTAVTANLELAVVELGELERRLGITLPPELVEELGDARVAGDRIRRVVSDLQVFSRPDEDRHGTAKLDKVLDATLRMAWNQVRHRARLVKDYGTVPVVRGTESQLGQVFLNLVVNAAQAIPEGSADAQEIRVTTRLDDRGRVAVEVRDSGSGMPPEVVGRLFTPFFTTKPVGTGMGLGLAICHRIVTSIGGEITVESQTGKGTVFRVFLPAAQGTAESKAPVVEQPAPRRGRVLVVDDESMIGTIVRRSLDADHEVVTASHGQEALDRVTQGERFDVILCDLMMPQMTGVDLYEALMREAPGHAYRMVFISGGAFTTRAREFLDRVRNTRLQKPFDARALRAVVNERLAEPAPVWVDA